MPTYDTLETLLRPLVAGSGGKNVDHAGDSELTNTMEARENIRRMVRRSEALTVTLHHYRTAGIESTLRWQVANVADEGNEAQMHLAERIEPLKIGATRRAA